MKTAVLALALSLTPVAAEAWAPRPMPSLHKSAPMRAEAAVAVSGGSDARAGPAGVYDAAVTLGAGKAATPISKLIPLSFLSGAHIALGAMLAVSVGGSVPGIKAGLDLLGLHGGDPRPPLARVPEGRIEEIRGVLGSAELLSAARV